MLTDPSALEIGPAGLDEFEPALGLLFRAYPAEERARHVGRALDLIDRGELDPAGLWVARRPGRTAAERVVGVALAELLPGALGLAWPPRLVTEYDSPAAARRLLESARDWLRNRGAKLAQLFRDPDDPDDPDPVLQAGFRYLTRVLTLAAGLVRERPFPPAPPPPGLALEPYGRANAEAFLATLTATYEGSLDCPELNGVRRPEDVLAGYLADPGTPTGWYLARLDARPAGVLLLAAAAEPAAMTLSYLGVVPAYRRRGVGRALVGHALRVARARGGALLSVAADVRNAPALHLYRRFGFEVWDRREVYLLDWSRR